MIGLIVAINGFDILVGLVVAVLAVAGLGHVARSFR